MRIRRPPPTPVTRHITDAPPATVPPHAASSLTSRRGRDQAEGIELMILTLKERKYASRCALRVLDAALRDNGANCERFVDIRGFKTLFPLVGGAPPPQPSFAKGEGRSRPPPASPPAARIAAYTAGRRICTTTRTHSTPLVAHTDPAV